MSDGEDGYEVFEYTPGEAVKVELLVALIESGLVEPDEDSYENHVIKFFAEAEPDDPESNKITVRPADIGIYTGGEGYGYVVDGAGEVVEGGTGLPEPGFYVTLPWWLDGAFEDGNLSGELTFSYGGEDTEDYRKWTLEPYDADGESSADGGRVYRLVPAEGQAGVRLQFSDGDKIITSDEFTPAADELYKAI